MKTERMHALETKTRLSKILVDSEQFLNSLKKARRSEFEVSLSEDTSCNQLLVSLGKLYLSLICIFHGTIPWLDDEVK